jgi:type I restriction enzyme S subunit
VTWSSAALGDICNIEVGKTPSRAEPDFWRSGTLPWLSIADMNQGRFLTSTKESVTEAGAKAARMKLVAPGTLLLSFKLSLGKVGIANIPLFTNEAIAALTDLRSDVNTDYMYWALRNADFLGGSDRAAMGNTLNKAKLKEIRIPLPPLPEQRRIAAILDKADALRAKRREAIAKLDQLLQSVFLEMFGDPVTNPKSWPVCELGDLIHAAQDGPHVSPEYSESGIPFLSTRHVRAGSIRWEDLKYLSQAEAEIQWRKCRPERGDILYTKGGTTGLAATVETDEPFAVWVHVALLKTNFNRAHPKWLTAMLNSKYCFEQSQRYTHGIANRDLGLKRMVKIKMYQPPLEVQRRFAEFSQHLVRKNEQLIQSSEALDKLFGALQNRAFTGSL